MLELVHEMPTIYFRAIDGNLTQEMLVKIHDLLSREEASGEYWREMREINESIDWFYYCRPDEYDKEKMRELLKERSNIRKKYNQYGEGYSLELSFEEEHKGWYRVYRARLISSREEIDWIKNSIKEICGNIELEFDEDLYVNDFRCWVE